MNAKELLSQRETTKFRDRYSGAEFLYKDIAPLIVDMMFSNTREANEFAYRFDVVNRNNELEAGND